MSEDLGYLEVLLGHWMVQYSGADAMIIEDYAEQLELKVDGTFSWRPTPLWAKQNGRWGVTVDDDSGHIRLYVQERNGGTYRSNWLVITALPLGGDTAVMLHWQRTSADVVLFYDRLLVARQITP